MVRERVTAFGEPGNVSISLAQDLIRSSAFWVDHRQGIIHPEPGWADRIVKGSDGWEVKFGANYFLVEQAILHCKRTILGELDHAEKSSQLIDRKLLYRRLITCVRISVANWNHDPFSYYTGGAAPEVKAQGYYIGGKKFSTLSELGRYGSTPPSMDVWEGYMKFGSHAIKVDAVIERICQVAGLNTVE